MSLIFSPSKQSSSNKKQRGQGMSEYMIIVALIAVSAIGVVGFVGDSTRHQMTAIAGEIAGQSGNTEQAAAVQAAADAQTTAATHFSLDNFTNKNGQTNAGGN